MKKLYRSTDNKIFAGVIGGLGDYFDIDPSLLRIIWLIILVFTGFIPGIIVYLLAIFVMPGYPTEQKRSGVDDVIRLDGESTRQE